MLARLVTICGPHSQDLFGGTAPLSQLLTLSESKWVLTTSNIYNKNKDDGKNAANQNAL
jgi:hypothetical protein